MPIILSSAYKLNKQGDNTQPWHTPLPIWNQSIVPCLVLAVASWPVYKCLKRQVRWSGIPVCCDSHNRMLLWKCCSQYGSKFGKLSSSHTGKGQFSFQSKEGKCLSPCSRSRFFREFSCFFCDPTDVGSLISDCSAFSKSSLYISKFSVHVLLNPSLEDLGHFLLTCEMSAIVW